MIRVAKAATSGGVSASPVHRVYLSPGLFGFVKLASFAYFAQLERALREEFAARGERVQIELIEVQPTASIRRRAERLAQVIERTCGDDDGPIHLLGHSTGGLDARLLASPSCTLTADGERWLGRLRSVSTLSTPHYGTPLASFFATAGGQKVLYAMSAFTIVALLLGRLPLGAFSTLGAAFLRSSHAVGLELHMLERATDGLLGLLAPGARGEVVEYLRALKDDQGGVIQLTPEAMDLFQAGIEDRPGVHYQCTAAMVAQAGARQVAGDALQPTRLASLAMFTALRTLTSRYDSRYPCAARDAGAQSEAKLREVFGRTVGVRANDGVVPLRSQLWGELVWAGYADHLDVLGHFRGEPLSADERARGALPHRDWIHSGAGYHRGRFLEMVRALVDGMLRASAPR